MARDEHGHPVIPHEVVGGEDCHGCLIIQVRGDHADIVCNACDVFIRSAPTTEVDAILTSMARGAICSHRCPHCQALNTFPGFSAPIAYICPECGKRGRCRAAGAVAVGPRPGVAERVEKGCARASHHRPQQVSEKGR